MSSRGRSLPSRWLMGLAVGLVAVLLPACRDRTTVEPATSRPAVTASAGRDAGPGSWRKWSPAEPIIDSHVHIAPTEQGLKRALAVFKQAGIGRFVVKSGGPVGSPRYQATLHMRQRLGGRMRVFANLDWRGIDDPKFAEEQELALEQAAQDGIAGIKIFKALGLGVRTADGKLLKVDDPRLAPIFDACGRLGLIVAWHVADPVAFFQPVTPANERYDELRLAEQWSFYGQDFPSHDELLAARDRVLERHPKTTFLLIHLANYPENLRYVDALLDQHPNVYVDTSARLGEIGRHPPAEVRALLIKHQDRILFGSDFISGPHGEMQLGSTSATEPTLADAALFYERHWRYFETAERQIDHPTPIQGKWKIDAVDLPVPVLRKLYVENARKLLFDRAR